ncbi:MAG: hypothetical protein FWG45_03890 [Oscillospiraceae bacterium]|nr:hypothetical protein [Oscillospiraceae bacterium]
MIKLFYGILATSLCLVFVACAESNSAPANHETDTEPETTTNLEKEFVIIEADWNSPPKPTHDGVELIVNNVSAEGIEFEFKNDTDSHFSFGRYFQLFESQDNTWVEIVDWTDKPIEDISNSINPQSGIQYTHEWFFFCDPIWVEKPEKTTLDSGEYMFVVPYSQGGGQGVPPTGTYSARHVFTIE